MPPRRHHSALVARAEQHEQPEEARAEAEHPAEQPREGPAVHLRGDSERFGDLALGLVQEGGRVSGCHFEQTVFLKPGSFRKLGAAHALFVD